MYLIGKIYDMILFADHAAAASVHVLELPIRADFKSVRQKGVNSVVAIDDLGYSYSISAANRAKGDDVKTWRCSKKNKRCRASITTENDWITVKRNVHNHAPTKVYRPVAIDADDIE